MAMAIEVLNLLGLGKAAHEDMVLTCFDSQRLTAHKMNLVEASHTCSTPKKHV